MKRVLIAIILSVACALLNVNNLDIANAKQINSTYKLDSSGALTIETSTKGLSSKDQIQLLSTLQKSKTKVNNLVLSGTTANIESSLESALEYFPDGLSANTNVKGVESGKFISSLFKVASNNLMLSIKTSDANTVIDAKFVANLYNSIKRVRDYAKNSKAKLPEISVAFSPANSISIDNSISHLRDSLAMKIYATVNSKDNSSVPCGLVVNGVESCLDISSFSVKLSKNSKNKTTAKLSWKAYSFDKQYPIKEFTVYYQNEFGKVIFSKTIAGDKRSYKIKGVYPGKQTFKIIATNDLGSGHMVTVSKAVKIALINTSNIKFNDISKLGKDRKASIKWLVRTNIAVGKKCSNGSGKCFMPNDLLERGAMADLLYVFIGSPALHSTKGYFTGDNWFKKLNKNDPKRAKRVVALAEANVTTGCAFTTWRGVSSKSKNDANHKGLKDAFCPYDVVTRGQMASFLYNLAGAPYVSEKDNVFTKDSQLKKLKKTDKVRWSAIVWFGKTKISLGYDGNSKRFAPEKTMNRGAIAQFLKKYYKVITTGKALA